MLRGRLGRSPTFFVGAERQRSNLDGFHRQEQQLAEAYNLNKALCFSARGYQRTHPVKARRGAKDADARLQSPMLLGVADGVSQIEDYGIDASELPNELLKRCEDLGIKQLLPGGGKTYCGPIPLVREAFESTESLGSTTLVLAVLDNSTKIHGKLHPMIAVISIGDCELLILRRLHGRRSRLEAVFHTEMQRIDGHFQTPLQLARVDDRIDPDFHEGITIEVIEKGSAVHCVSAYEGDIVIMGSDGVFDNLFLDEVAELCNSVLEPGNRVPTSPALLGQLARQIVEACHAKTQPGENGAYPEAPIGIGGKVDDTSCVVAEVVEWTEEHRRAWAPTRYSWFWEGLASCRLACTVSDDEEDLQAYDEGMQPPGAVPARRSRSRRSVREDETSEEASEEAQCSIS